MTSFDNNNYFWPLTKNHRKQVLLPLRFKREEFSLSPREAWPPHNKVASRKESKWYCVVGNRPFLRLLQKIQNFWIWWCKLRLWKRTISCKVLQFVKKESFILQDELVSVSKLNLPLKIELQGPLNRRIVIWNPYEIYLLQFDFNWSIFLKRLSFLL